MLKNASKDAKLRWSAHGCPNAGLEWEMYQTNKRAYKKAVKEQKHKGKLSRVNKLLDAWKEGNNKKFWKCVGNYCSDNDNTNRTNILNPVEFVDVFKANFVDSSLNFLAYETYINDRVNALNGDENMIEFQICDWKLP